MNKREVSNGSERFKIDKILSKTRFDFHVAVTLQNQ